MHLFRLLLIGSLLAPACLAYAQPSHDTALLERLAYHVYYLADDSLEGRAPGSEGEKKAATYIIQRFSEIGLTPAGYNGGWTVPFTFTEGRKPGKDNLLLLNNTSYSPDSDFYPLSFSGNGRVSASCVHVSYGIVAPELNHNDYSKLKKLKGKIFLINISTPEGIHPHQRFGGYIDLRMRAEEASARGAAAVIFYSEDSEPKNYPEMNDGRNIYPLPIPVIFIKNRVWEEIKPLKKLQASLSSNMVSLEKTGINVAGMIDNKASTTVVVGAHYDHLGYGSGNSLHRGEPAIHNGADDNASGVSLMIELARHLKQVGPKNNNYLFVAFSGEESGLYGSKEFVHFLGNTVKNINYMLNFDMVGRLDTLEKKMEVNGFGTSPAWSVLLNIPTELQIKTSPSGIGPSDHTSFYLRNIPVLHFFTGAHRDYHKPSDDAHLVNYAGMAAIFSLVGSLIDSLDNKGRIPFTATAADSSRTTPRFKVTLGIIPDYLYSNKGVRIDGVTEGKPAHAAGLKAGDVILQLGNYPVADMSSYMQALSRFSKGDATTVTIKREEQILHFNITF
ncbi:MAG: hypothetical protein KatS3mg031_2524 [Chitinophagales bacterium]|nr:MAG: hypothetical protein KatS3mg031_2524 [Chitinophagales bacterium]